MLKIILPDIFGVTSEFERLCDTLKGNVQILNPYKEKYLDFPAESDAYQYFNTYSSLDRYAKQLYDTISSTDHHVSLLGFSMGGSAIWKISDRQNLANRCSALCYYPGQIRHHTTINPVFPIKVILPSKEDGFVVDELEKNLQDKALLVTYRCKHLHGFMNKQSVNFDAAAYDACIQVLKLLKSEQPYSTFSLPPTESILP